MTNTRPFEAIDRAVAVSREADVEGVVVSTASGLTRFAESAIHQNVYEENATLMVRVAVGNRVAGARTNLLNPTAIEDTVRKAIHIAKATPPDPVFPGLAEPQPVSPNGRFVEGTAHASPMDRVRRVREFLERTSRLSAAGALETESRGGCSRQLARGAGCWALHGGIICRRRRWRRCHWLRRGG